MNLVDKILALKDSKAENLGTNEAEQNSKSKQKSELENQIDKLVYALYDLNESEIKLIENK